MRYVLIANNENLNSNHIDEINLQHDDVVVLFNKTLPLFEFPVIKEHPHKYLVSRRTDQIIDGTRVRFSGIHIMEETQKYFEKIFLVAFCFGDKFPELKKEVIENLTSTYSYLDFGKIEYLCPTLLKNKKHKSSGLFFYEFLTNLKKEDDKIILVGFTSDIGKSHDSKFERDFFASEAINGCKIIGGLKKIYG